MSNPTVAIPQERVSELEAAIAKLNKRADKIGCAPISLEVGDPFEKQVSETQWHTFVPVRVNGEAPKLNGWVFVATLEHDENGTLIRRLPAFDSEVDLTQYRKSTPDNCDHCGYRRRRNDTYVVWNEETGETKQVGSSCLKDFIGHENPEAIARHLQTIRDLIEDIQGGSYSGGRITPRYDLRTVLSVAVAEVADNGYVTRKAAWDDPDLISTSEAVRTRWHRYRSSEGERAKITPQHMKAADAIIDWVRALEENDLTNDYLWNLFTVCKGESIEEGQFGIAASAVKAAQNAVKHGKDGDRHQGQVTRTQDEPTDKQVEFIERLTEQLSDAQGYPAEGIQIPATRIEASDLINDLKVQVKAAREAKKAPAEPPATKKQLSFINRLMDQKSIPTVQRQKARAKIDAGLTKSAASKCIEWLQEQEDAE